MPLTFEQAKLQVNPDPIWQPTRDSPEYFEILTVMRQSGTLFPDPTRVRPPLTVKDVYYQGSYRAPIECVKSAAINPPVSKKDFLSVPCNRKKFDEHLARHRLTK